MQETSEVEGECKGWRILVQVFRMRRDRVRHRVPTKYRISRHVTSKVIQCSALHCNCSDSNLNLKFSKPR